LLVLYHFFLGLSSFLCSNYVNSSNVVYEGVKPISPPSMRCFWFDDKRSKE